MKQAVTGLSRVVSSARLYSTARGLSRKVRNLSNTRSHLLNEKKRLLRNHMNTSRIKRRIKKTEEKILNTVFNSLRESRKKSHPIKGGQTRRKNRA